ncbi:hypothetical protein ABIC28_005092 [Rhodococcus sp. PvR044]|uniref:hypothetical protein n=1 Tax=Rhodococcus sp. PvR044 TaxID=3156402 RepID=UPI00339218E6
MTTPAPAFIHPSDQAAERGTHYLEGVVRVYMMRSLDDTDTWVLDPASIGDEALLGDEDVENGNCPCERPDECNAAVERMEQLFMPSAEELMHMLATALDFTATKN